MDDRKQYTASSIPRRETGPGNGTPALDNAGDSYHAVKTPGGRTRELRPNSQISIRGAQRSGDSAQFTEIEYGSDLHRSPSDGQAQDLFPPRNDMLNHYPAGYIAAANDTILTSPQPIAQRAYDPIREKFFEMRSLASDRPFARDDSELFYRQAKFMEDFTDDYTGGAKFSMYYPYYQRMGYDQLRTYFTWRTKVRGGEILPTSESYIFLYVYELLSGIGVDGADDGLNKLLKIWDGLSRHCAALEKYMPKWLKDYHIYYELPHSFTDFAKEHNMQKYYSLTMIFETGAESNFDLWNSISTYDVTQSRFYNDGNGQLFNECFEAALRGISEFCDSRGKSFEELFIYKISNRVTWKPFNHALFHNKRRQPDRQVVMPGKEHYYCKNDRWSANLPIYYSNYKDYAGYILKKTESCLRQVLKYKYKLTAELIVRNGYYKELAVTGTELDGVIEKAVADFHRNKNRLIVTVDHANLARIREEALGTQEALIVPDDGAVFPDLTAPEDSTAPFPKRAPPEAAGVCAGISLANTDWSSLREALSAMELEALSMALSGVADIKTFADKNGIMLEVLADEINGKASDCIGDSIIETDGGISIYDEYRENIAEMMKDI